MLCIRRAFFVCFAKVQRNWLLEKYIVEELNKNIVDTACRKSQQLLHYHIIILASNLYHP